MNLFPLMDAYSNVFESIGKRTTGNEAQLYVIIPPNCDLSNYGEVPKNIKKIHAPTNTVWMLGRFEAKNDTDGRNSVWPLQDGVTLTPLSRYGKNYTPPLGKVDETVAASTPIQRLQEYSTSDYFNQMTTLLGQNTPPTRDARILKEMSKIGIVPGQPFINNYGDLFDDIHSKANASLEAMHHTGSPSIAIESQEDKQSGYDTNGWKVILDNIGDFGVHYTQRAFIAFAGLGANLIEDAIYPSMTHLSNGDSLNSSNKYKVTFGKGQLPPVNAFWSLTVYGSDDELVPNSLNKYAVSDRSSLGYNADGSLDIYVQSTAPDSSIPQSNWLPSATEPGQMTLTLRLYWPREEVLNVKWELPTVNLNN